MIKENIVSGILFKIMVSIFVLIIASAIFFGTYDGTVTEASVLIYSALFTLILAVLSKKYGSLLGHFSDSKNIIILSVICFAVKFLWVYFMRIEPQVDYATFYNTAVDCSKHLTFENRYVALFPHIMGYSTFLSIFIYVFGESYFVASILNVLLTVVSGILMYKIIRTLISTPAAVMNYILWIVCPSQTMYNNLVLSEPLYTMFILAFVYLIVCMHGREEKMNAKHMALCGISAGIILQCVNVNRPIGMILVISMFIRLLLLRFDELKSKSFAIKQTCFLSAMLVVYFAFGSLWSGYVTVRLGEEPATVPGYNIHVGFNTNSNGCWNVEDAELLTHYSNQENATADMAQNQMLERAKERIFSGEINFLNLFKKKIGTFLGTDSACVEYNSGIISNKELLSKICNIFYYCLLLLNLLGAFKFMKLSHRNAAFIMPLFTVGITLAQMLVEVAPRYHYSVVPFLIMIPQFYLFGNRVTKESK